MEFPALLDRGTVLTRDCFKLIRCQITNKSRRENLERRLRSGYKMVVCSLHAYVVYKAFSGNCVVCLENVVYILYSVL